MMQDRKALQAGTSHFLGQNFAKASNIKFQNDKEHEEYAWTTSWGASTRLIGGLIMIHGDDNGIILPPRVASSHVVLMPIIRKPEESQAVMEYTDKTASLLRKTYYHGSKIRVEIDKRNIGGARGWEWIKKGIPIRVEIGPRDMAEDSVFVGRRDKDNREKFSMKRREFTDKIPKILDDIQKNLFKRALKFRDEHSVKIDDNKEFYDFFTPKNMEKPEIHGGFAYAHWCGDDKCETKIKEDLQVTIRCIPLDNEKEDGECICCGKKSKERVIFAKAY